MFRADLESLAADLDHDPFYDRWRDFYRDLPRFIGWDDDSSQS